MRDSWPQMATVLSPIRGKNNIKCQVKRGLLLLLTIFCKT